MEFLEAIDQGSWNSFQSHRTRWLDLVMVSIGTLGAPWLLTLVVLAVIGWLLVRRRTIRAAFVGGAFLGGMVLVAVTKVLVRRDAPEVILNPLEAPEMGSCFPSGRTLLATVVYLSLAPTAPAPRSTSPTRLLAVGAGTALILLIGVSRCYIGICYLTDVLAAWMAGLAWVLACGWVEEKWVQPSKQETAR